MKKFLTIKGTPGQRQAVPLDSIVAINEMQQGGTEIRCAQGGAYAAIEHVPDDFSVVLTTIAQAESNDDRFPWLPSALKAHLAEEDR